MPEEKLQEISGANLLKTLEHGSWRKKKGEGSKGKRQRLTPNTLEGKEAAAFKNKTIILYSV